jgi:very-short-patch-repair endonuclease
VPADVDPDVPEQRILEQSTRLGDGGAVSGWAGCRLHGAAFFDGVARDGRTLFPVPLVTGGTTLRSDGSVRILRDRLTPEDVVVRHGIRMTRVERSLFDAMRTAELREAVVAMDMAAAADLVSVARMHRYLSTRTSARGVRHVAKALALASEQSRSPNETRMRLVWVLDARLPTPLLNQPVFDRHGRLLGIVDLLDEQAGLVGEFDGADHRTAARHSSDVGREDDLRRVGLEVFRVTGPDLLVPDRVASRMRWARNRAAWEPEERRRWTTEPPAWWEGPVTLDEHLDAQDVLRSLHDAG